MRFILAVLAGLATSACTQLPYTGGARPVAEAQIKLDDHWLRAAPTPVVLQQQDTDCGLAALAMVAGAWGRNWSVNDLARAMSTRGGGVKLGVLRDYARSQGLDAFAVAATPRDLEHELGEGRPVLLGLMLPFDRGHNLSHYEVAIAFEPATGSVVTIDPATGRWMKRSRAVLDVEWKAAGYPALVVVGERKRDVLASPRWPSRSSTMPRSSSASI
jgi:ABC-type bacteriocin/lantibiotic exporter with double-glycine peptidase domain